VEVKPRIDRRKHEVDVLEHVMKGVRTQVPGRGGGLHVVERDIRGWTAVTVKSAIKVEVVDDDPDQR
jgi:hypothetical protein